MPHPHVIAFSFYVYGPGHYVWQCDYPCGTILFTITSIDVTQRILTARAWPLGVLDALYLSAAKGHDIRLN